MQLLFDIRFLFDILSGRFDNKNQWPEQLVTSIKVLSEDRTMNLIECETNIQTQLSALLKRIKSKLDPIDLAFYEPLLEIHVQKCYMRNLVSYGYFVQLNRLYSQT